MSKKYILTTLIIIVLSFGVFGFTNGKEASVLPEGAAERIKELESRVVELEEENEILRTSLFNSNDEKRELRKKLRQEALQTRNLNLENIALERRTKELQKSQSLLKEMIVELKTGDQDE